MFDLFLDTSIFNVLATLFEKPVPDFGLEDLVLLGLGDFMPVYAVDYCAFNDGAVVGLFNNAILFDYSNTVATAHYTSLNVAWPLTLPLLHPFSGYPEFTVSSIFLLFPDIFLAYFFLAFLLFVLFLKTSFRSFGFTDFVIFVSVLCIGFVFLLVLAQDEFFWGVIQWSFLEDKIIGGIFHYVMDSFILNPSILYLKLFVLFVVGLILLLSLNYFNFEKFQVFEYPFFVLFVLQGLFILLAANDFFIVYLSLEIQGFCFYILAALKKYSNLSIEAGLKYFILGSFSSSVFLFGISIIYGFAGTLNFSELSVLLRFENYFCFTDDFTIINFSQSGNWTLSSLWNSSEFIFGITIGLIFVSVGILFKLALFPFHFWIADVYQGSPMIVTLFFSTVAKISFWLLFVKVYFNVFVYFDFFIFPAINFFSAVSIIFGIIVSLYQEKIKRLLALSAISHMGFLTISVGSFDGFAASLFYFFTYILILINMFAVLLTFRKVINFTKIRNLVEFSILVKSHPMVAYIFMFSLLSAAGIPPLAGFFGKFFVFMAMYKQYSLQFFLIITLLSTVSSIFYLRLFGLCFLTLNKIWSLS